MLTLTQALLCRPRVLLIDQLSLGLAPSVVSELLEVVRQLADEGMTVVVVEQSLSVAVALAPRAVFMERGAVQFCGGTADLVERPDLARSVFLSGDGCRLHLVGLGGSPWKWSRDAREGLIARSGSAPRASRRRTKPLWWRSSSAAIVRHILRSPGSVVCSASSFASS